MKDSLVLLCALNILELLNKLLDLFIATIEPIRGENIQKTQRPEKGYPCYKPIR